MILIDTSVILDRIKTNDPKLVQLFATLPTATCGVFRAELRSGVRTAVEKQRILRIVNSMTSLVISDPDWDFIGDLRGYIGSCSLTMSLPDVAIAGIAMLNGIELWSRDKGHKRMQAFVPQLRLFAEPP